MHECFAEAIHRLFVDTFVNLNDCHADFLLALERLESEDEFRELFKQDTFIEFEKKYTKAKNDCLNGIHGKTVKFWMMYVTLMEIQHKLHYSINVNDFKLRLHCWKDIVSLCFPTNKQNYARYGSYYCLQLENLETSHPGALNELKKIGISVRRNTINIGQSIDGAGEQTFMRSAKTTGQ